VLGRLAPVISCALESHVGGDRSDGRCFRDCRRLHYGRIVPGNRGSIDQTLQADIYVSPPQTTANRVLGKLDPMIVDALKTWDGIRQVVTYNDANVQIVNQPKQN